MSFWNERCGQVVVAYNCRPVVPSNSAPFVFHITLPLGICELEPRSPNRDDMGIAKTMESYRAEYDNLRRMLRNFQGKTEWKGLSMERTKFVCVTNGTTHLGLWIARQLLLRSYTVRITVPTAEELQRLWEMEEFGSARNGLTAVVANMGDIGSLCEAFDGCYGVFHTSSFVDPKGVSGFTEHMVQLEVAGAENVVEACSRTPTVRRCVYTSSLVASIWRREPGDVDERSWSDEGLCREKKLWFALAKTQSERAAWRAAGERNVNLVSICPALVVGPGFPHANSTPCIAYLKGAREMYENNVLASVDVRKVAESHVFVYEKMEGGGASGRYICFEKVLNTAEDARDLQEDMNMQMGLLAGRNSDAGGGNDDDDGDGDSDGENATVHPHRLFNAKLSRLLSSPASVDSCRRG